jgi:quercetin dioxygenase-like cupin family protein
MSRPRPFAIHEEACAFEQWGDARHPRVRWRTLVSADRTPTGSLTLGVAELPPGGSAEFRLHRHEQPEVYYVVEGEGVVTISGVEHPVRPGSAVFIPGDAEHGAVNTGDGTLRLVYVFPADSFDEVRYEFSGP